MAYTKKDKASDILSGYNGANPYLLWLKSRLTTWKDEDILTDFNIDFVIRNQKFEPVQINKTIKIAKWFGEQKQKEWKTEFLPEKVRIISYLGDTERYYACYIMYRQTVKPITCFLPKNAVLCDFLHGDYHDINVDFDRYDRLAATKESGRMLYPHQKEAVQFLLSKKKAILADTMGTGKTTSLTVAAIEGNFDAILIICPASLKTNWKNELSYYLPDRDISIVDGFVGKTKTELEEFLGYPTGKSGKKKAELEEEAKERGKWTDSRFVIVNFDILDEFYKPSRAYTEKSIQELRKKYPLFNYLYGKKSLIVIDEAHRLSNKTSIRYKVISSLIKGCNPDSIYLSTGTPVTNMPENLYCLLKLIDAPIACDWNFYTERYCGAKKIYAKGEWKRVSDIFIKRKGKMIWSELTEDEKKACADFVEKYARKITIMKDPENVDELKEAISGVYLRREKEDVAQLPRKTVHEITYDLTEEQRKEYNRLWEEYEAAKTEENLYIELNKELLEGSIYRKYLAEQMVPKTIELADQFVDNGEKVIIACCYDNELYSIKDHYGDRCVIYNGKCSLKQKDAAIDSFKNDENVRVFVCNELAAGVGITLINSTKLIFCSFSYTYADNSQMEDRIHRIGQTKDCDIYYQMFNDTHCEHMWDIVLKKQYLSTTLITREKK